MFRMVKIPLQIAVTVFLLGGCAAPWTHLNDPARSTFARDVANLLPPRDIPYETSEKDGVAVSYNLFHSQGGNFAGYRLTLIIKNSMSVPQFLRPSVSLQEANGLLVQPWSYEAFVNVAATLAGTPVPPFPIQNQQNSFYSSGTITNTTTGTTYNYATSTAPAKSPVGSFAAGLAQGMAQGAARRAADDREEGQMMMRWANSFWLRNGYQVPSGAAVSGALFFPASAVGQAPLRLTVEVNGKQFVFTSVRK